MIFSGHGGDGGFLYSEDIRADVGAFLVVVGEAKSGAFIGREGEIKGGIKKGLEAFDGVADEDKVVTICQDRNVLVV